MEIIIKALSRERDITLAYVEDMLDSEINYQFTNDDDFIKERTAIVAEAQQPGGPQQPGMQGHPNQPGQDPRQ